MNLSKLTLLLTSSLLLGGCVGPKDASADYGLTTELRQHDQALGELERAREENPATQRLTGSNERGRGR